MKYFPLFLKMDKIQVLLVGGGNVATEKLEKIVQFTTDIKIISPIILDVTQEYIEKYHLHYEQRAYQTGDIKEFDMVVVAVDDIPLQKEIFDECKASNKLCNAVDSVEYCNFIFPAFIKKGGVTVAISTSGKSPAVAKHLKSYLDDVIPDDIGEFLDYMQELRKTMPKGKERMEFLSNEARRYFEKLDN